jgi:hypothetical protein
MTANSVIEPDLIAPKGGPVKSASHPEKLVCKTLDIHPGLRQMHGTRIAQLEVMAGANMAGGA